jgi:adenine specific DNA methylase Mod
MQSAMPEENPKEDLTTDSVEYYFDVLVDDEINQRQACKGAEVFNKESYYVDLDFDCDQEEQASSYYDIYGSVTEPEICQS